MVTDFLTPDTSCEYTYPPEFKQEIEREVGEYILDVRDFRSGNKEKILADIYEMTRKRFQLARHLLAKDDWDYFIMVEMGTDRIHHALWDNMDPAHRFYETGNKFENAIHDYYIEVDREIGELLKFADDATDVAGGFRSRGQTNGWRHLRKQMADGKRLPRLEGKAGRRRSVFKGENRLVANEGLGRWRLLCSRLSECRWPRTRRNDRARGLRESPRRIDRRTEVDPG